MLSFNGGIKPDAHKYTKSIPVAQALSPAYVKIAIYNDCPCVALGDKVSVGQSLTINHKAHSSISGFIKNIDGEYITVEADNENRVWAELTPFGKKLSDATTDDIIGFLSKKGICYDGEFLSEKLENAVNHTKILIISCGETAPFLCSKYKTFLEKQKEIIYGTKIIMKALGLSKAAVTVEASYLKEIRDFKNILGKNSRIEVFTHTSKYPADHPAIIKREFLKKYVSKTDDIKEGDILLLSCEEVAAAFHSFKTGMPMVSRYVTVDGDVAYDPKTMEVAIGAPIEYLLELCEAERDSILSFICGNPLASHSIGIDSYIEKVSSSILFFGKKFAENNMVRECISCGRCHRVCPMGLYPNLLIENNLKNHKCIGCGSCTYICPSKIDFSVLYNIEEERV